MIGLVCCSLCRFVTEKTPVGLCIEEILVKALKLAGCDIHTHNTKIFGDGHGDER